MTASRGVSISIVASDTAFSVLASLHNRHEFGFVGSGVDEGDESACDRQDARGKTDESLNP